MTSTIMRVLVSGSRNWASRQAVLDVLDAVAASWAADGGTEMVVVHGGADGVDMFAQSWVRHAERPPGLRVRPEVHPADWKKHGRRAGYVRNQELVDRGADVCLAFLARCVSSRCKRSEPHWSHGTSMCRDMAEAAGIRVQEFFEESADA